MEKQELDLSSLLNNSFDEAKLNEIAASGKYSNIKVVGESNKIYVKVPDAKDFSTAIEDNWVQLKEYLYRGRAAQKSNAVETNTEKNYRTLESITKGEDEKLRSEQKRYIYLGKEKAQVLEVEEKDESYIIKTVCGGDEKRYEELCNKCAEVLSILGKISIIESALQSANLNRALYQSHLKSEAYLKGDEDAKKQIAQLDAVYKTYKPMLEQLTHFKELAFDVEKLEKGQARQGSTILNEEQILKLFKNQELLYKTFGALPAEYAQESLDGFLTRAEAGFGQEVKALVSELKRTYNLAGDQVALQMESVMDSVKADKSTDMKSLIKKFNELEEEVRRYHTRSYALNSFVIAKDADTKPKRLGRVAQLTGRDISDLEHEIEKPTTALAQLGKTGGGAAAAKWIVEQATRSKFELAPKSRGEGLAYQISEYTDPITNEKKTMVTLASYVSQGRNALNEVLTQLLINTIKEEMKEVAQKNAVEFDPESLQGKIEVYENSLLMLPKIMVSYRKLNTSQQAEKCVEMFSNAKEEVKTLIKESLVANKLSEKEFSSDDELKLQAEQLQKIAEMKKKLSYIADLTLAKELGHAGKPVDITPEEIEEQKRKEAE
ncbi:MAG: hypothetical protein QW559_03685 [Candidatus Woesearchaeota archaeon]